MTIDYKIVHEPPTAMLAEIVELTKYAFWGNLSVHYKTHPEQSFCRLFHCGKDVGIWDYGYLVNVGENTTNKNMDSFTRISSRYDLSDPTVTAETIAIEVIKLLSLNEPPDYRPGSLAWPNQLTSPQKT